MSNNENYKKAASLKIKKAAKIAKISVIIMLLILLAYVIYAFLTATNIAVDDWDQLWFEQEEVESGWILTVTYAHEAWSEYDGFDYNNIVYELNGTIFGKIHDIDRTWDETNTIIFYDNDNNNLVSKNDTFIISKNSQIQIRSGTELRFDTSGGRSFHIYIE